MEEIGQSGTEIYGNGTLSDGYEHNEPGPSRLGQGPLVTPGIKDSDGFLTPPPASTLLLRRTRMNSSGSSDTFVASSQGPGPSSQSSLGPGADVDPLTSTMSMDMRKSFSVPYRRLHKRSSRDRRAEPCYNKRLSFANKKVNVLLTPQQGPHVQVNVPGNGLHRSNFPPISPLALDPAHALSVTLSSDRSISTVVPIDSYTHPGSVSNSNPFVFPSAPPSTSVNNLNAINNAATNDIEEVMDMEKIDFHHEDDDRAFRGKPAAFASPEETPGSSIGKGMPARKSSGKQMKRRRGERGPDRFPNIDPSTGKRRYIRKKRFTLEKRSSTGYRSRVHGRSHSALEEWRTNYDHELAGKWRPTDDLRLIINVQQINDLELVYRGVRFSCKFTLENIERRWAGLLYNRAIAKVALNSIQNLHPRVVASIHDSALFSAEEDRILKAVRSTHEPKSVKSLMEKLLKDHALVFLKWRTAKSLVEHWLHLRDYHMLCDQNVKDYFEQESFSEFEDNLTEQEVREHSEMDPNIRREILLENRHTKKMIRTLEEEVSRWQVLADMVTEIEQTPFEEGSFAMLRGKQVRYLMRSREITLGRRTPTSLNVDADLSMEGSTYKVSRRQAMIQLRTLGDFVIMNQGKHAIYVDGNVVMPKKLGPIVDQSVIEIAQLRFVFLINHKLVAEQRKKWIRIEVKKEMLRLAKIARFIKAHPAYPIVHPSHPLNSGNNEMPPNSGTNPNVSSNALATIDSVASNSSVVVGSASSKSVAEYTTPGPLVSTVTTRFTGSLTRPPQPPKFSASSSTSTTFIRSFISPVPVAGSSPTTSGLIPKVTAPTPLFRKPAPPPFPTIITQSERLGSPIMSSSNVGRLQPTIDLFSSSSSSYSSSSLNRAPIMTKHVAIHSGRPTAVQMGLVSTPATLSSATVTSASLPVSVVSITTPKAGDGSIGSNLSLPPPPTYTSPFPTGQRSPTVLITPQAQGHGIVGSGALADLTIRPGQPPSNLNKN